MCMKRGRYARGWSRLVGRVVGWIGVVAAVMAVCLGAFMVAGRIGRLLGITGSVVLARLLGVLLAALAVQFVIDGVRVVLNR